MLSKRSKEGWLFIDPGGGPPVSQEAAAASGKKVIGAGIRGVNEHAVFTCSHCHFLCDDPREDRNWCYQCDKWTCSEPACVAASKLGCRQLRAMMDESRPNELAGLIGAPFVG